MPFACSSRIAHGRFCASHRRSALGPSLALVAAALLASVAAAQDISVTGGDVQSNSAPTSATSLTVSGTSAGGSPSTYSADAPLTLSNYLRAYGSGVVNANADITVANPAEVWGVEVWGGGVLNLNAGTLSTNDLSLRGAGSLIQGGGHVAINRYLSLNDGATMTYGLGDSVGRSIFVGGGGTLTLDQDLLLTETLGVSGNSSFIAAGHHYSVGYLVVSDQAAVTYGPGDTIATGVVVGSAGSLTLARNLDIGGVLNVQSGGTLLRTTETISANSFDIRDATLDIRATDTFNPMGLSYVKEGGVVNAAAGSNLGQVWVYGVNGANAPATLDVNGNTTAVDIRAYSSGVVNLASGTLSTDYLSLWGAGALAQNGGHYAVGTGWLGVYDGAAVTYGPGDSVAQSIYVANGGSLTLGQDLTLFSTLYLYGSTSFTAAGHNYSAANLNLGDHAAVTYGPGDSVSNSVQVSDSSSLTLAQDLAITGGLQVSSGASITRTTQSIAAEYYVVDDATLDIGATDTFGLSYWNYVRYGGVLNAAAGSNLGYVMVFGANGSSAPATLNVNGDTTAASVYAYSSGVVNLHAGTLTTDSLVVDGAGALAQSGGHYAVGSGYLGVYGGAAVTYGPGDNVAQTIYVANGGSLTLGQDLALANTLSLYGSTSFTASGHNYSAANLSIGDHAAVTYGPGDNVSNAVQVSGTSSLTLAQDLAITGGLRVESGGSIARTTQSIAAEYFVVDDATLDIGATDTFGLSYWNYVSYGGVLNATAGSNLGYVMVYGANGSSDPATLNVNGDTAAMEIDAYSAGVVNLHAGTLSANYLSLSGVGSATQTGGHYAVSGLSLTGGATLTYGLGDSVGSLSIADAGSLLDELSPLSLTALSISNGGVLRLDSFTGSGAVSNWGLRVDGDQSSYLNTLILGNLITGPSLQVLYDSGSNFTYITTFSSPVPEIDPASGLSALSLAIGALGLLERRGRRRTSARA